MSSTHESRLRAVRDQLTAPPAHGTPPIDAALITANENRAYVSGFSGSAGQLLITASAALLFTDFRYIEQAGAQAAAFEVRKTEGPPWPDIAQAARGLGVTRVAFEAEHVSVATFQRLESALTEMAIELVPTHDLVEAVRQVKGAPEIEAIRRAVEVADRAFESVAAALRPGVTEREVAWRLEVAMREAGAAAVSFPIIVASGPNGAMPHHRASDRAIRRGEPVVIDMGCVLNGYCSDMTRTITLGEPDATFWEIYRIVLRAQQACEAGLKAGMLGKEGDALARTVIEQAGHGDHFGHGTGHGVGLQVHEEPYLSKTRGEKPVPAGAVVTVEPGIYLPGWGGVRIEDMVVAGTNACQVLTTAHKFPIVEIDRP